MKTITVPALLSVALALAFAFAAAPLSAAERLRAGQWEITTTRPKLETTTVKHCVDAEEAASVNGDEKAFRSYLESHGGQACKIVESKLNGPSASYTLTCGEMTMRVTATYHGDDFEGDRSTKSGAGPERLSHFKAKRIGSCP